MHLISRPGGRRVARPALGSMLSLPVVALLLLATALPATGAAARKLSEPSVSPRSATTATTIVFEVTYTRPTEAELVRVSVAGASHAMTLQTAGEWAGEGRYRWAGKLPAGSHAVVFQGDGVKDLDGGTVTVAAPPTPSPKPTPTPSPKPTPTPTPRPNPSPTATPRPTPIPTPTPKPTPTADPTPPVPTPAVPTPNPTPPDAGLPAPAGSATPDAEPTSSGEPAPSAPPSSPQPSPSGGIVTGALPGSVQPGGGTPGNGGVGGNGVQPDNGAAAGRWSPEGALLAALGWDGVRLPSMALAPTLVASTGAATMAMAFSLFGRRRRPEDEDDTTLADRAAQGVSVLEAPFEEAVAAALAAVPEIPDVEAGMPRWRRPSLLQARKADPVRDAVEAPRLTFDNGLIGPIDGRERHVIKYNVVTLLDAPDEIRANGIGVLTQGDEVQLLEKRGVYWHVLCPDGSQGWVHKMTVGEAVGAPRNLEGPRATMPTVAESWTLAEDDIDDDVMSAYLDARRRGD